MTTSKFTFVIDGQEPTARSIFAFEAFTQKQKDLFNKENRVYVCRNSEGMFFSKNLADAYIFQDEYSACSVIDTLNNSKNMNDCDWNTILLIDGDPANNEQIEDYANF